MFNFLKTKDIYTSNSSNFHEGRLTSLLTPQGSNSCGFSHSRERKGFPKSFFYSPLSLLLRKNLTLKQVQDLEVLQDYQWENFLGSSLFSCISCHEKINVSVLIRGKDYCSNCANKFFNFLKGDRRKCDGCGSWKKIVYEDCLGLRVIFRLCASCSKEFGEVKDGG